MFEYLRESLRRWTVADALVAAFAVFVLLPVYAIVLGPVLAAIGVAVRARRFWPG